jgi:hypothetical protein
MFTNKIEIIIEYTEFFKILRDVFGRRRGVKTLNFAGIYCGRQVYLGNVTALSFGGFINTLIRLTF